MTAIVEFWEDGGLVGQEGDGVEGTAQFFDVAQLTDSVREALAGSARPSNDLIHGHGTIDYGLRSFVTNNEVSMALSVPSGCGVFMSAQAQPDATPGPSK